MSTTSQQGFTLIELMITVVIIAILASIALPSYKNYIKKSKVQAGQSDLVGLALSAESNYQRQLSYPTASFQNATDIHSKFTTWAPSSTDFAYSYNSTDGKGYTLKATGNSTSPVANCVLTLDNAGVKNITGCDPITQWTN